jgi:type IV pilus assembly protein PilE
MRTGFSLLELMIVIFIIGILSAVAVPSYQSYIARGHRTDAKAILMEASSWVERQFLANNCYNKDSPINCASQDAGNTLALPSALSRVPKTGATIVYNVSFSSQLQDSFTLQAVPAAGGPMNSDSCGTLTLSNTGNKTANGSSTAATIDSCWNN